MLSNAQNNPPRRRRRSRARSGIQELQLRQRVALPSLAGWWLLASATLSLSAATKTEPLSTWPQAYSFQRDASRLTLSTPFYVVQHDLTNGGAISKIQLSFGSSSNLLVSPMETSVRNLQDALYSDLNDRSPRVHRSHTGLTEMVQVNARLLDRRGQDSGVRLKTTFEYHWGYIKIHKEFQVGSAGFRAREVCALSTVVAPSLSDYGYRKGVTEQEKAPPFDFGSCVWGKLAVSRAGIPVLKTEYVPRFVMFADPGVEGFEWFAGSDLAQWECELTGKRGSGQFVLQHTDSPAGTAFSLSPVFCTEEPVALPKVFALDYYLGIPIRESHARKPWFHSSFNRNQGNWVTLEQIRKWAESGIQTVHCHNDGDYYGDGLFWRDGSYPPYPDMEKYDKVIADCHQAGIRVATYFSDKELHPSTKEFQEHGAEWGRKNQKGNLQHNFYRGTNEFGAQMCLHSGWLDFLKFSIDRVLTHHRLDGVYYDWNVALLCCNGLHEGKPAGAAATGHWDIDELLQLMEWTRHRVGPKGVIIVHNTTTPMFATENFADYVVANEWGYGKWSDRGPELKDLQLEWSLVGARPRGVISYGQLDSNSPRRLYRLFALEALLSGVTPWPASQEAFELYPVLAPIDNIETCRFADWRNQAVTLDGSRCASAIYSRPGESYVLLGNLEDKPQQVRCTLHPEKLPYPLRSLTAASIVPLSNKSNAQPAANLDVRKLSGAGVELAIPADGVILVRIN